MSPIFKRALYYVALFAIVCAMFSIYVTATTISLLDNTLSVSDSQNNIKNSSGTLTATASGGLFSQKTNTITITNGLNVEAKLTFSYSANNYKSFSQSSASGVYESTLAAGGKVTLSITGKVGLSNTTATLTLSDFKLTAFSASSDVTFTYDSTYGSITVAGATVANGGVKNISADGAALVATVANGGTFLGWVDAADGSILSTATSYTLVPATDMQVQAVFIGTNSPVWYGIGTGTTKTQKYGFLSGSSFNYYTVPGYTKLFDNLSSAITAASNSSSKYIVPLNSGTLPAGDYTIPAGVTLLIPFDSANTMYTTAAQYTETYDTPTEYRTLTMADGAKLIINGSMSISAKQKYAAGGSTYGGMPAGNTGFVRMNDDSSITVNNGGALYTYGYIIGSGTITAKSGASVYEGFQIMDFRGGDQSTSMENKVFPLSQYYVQNIEVPLTLEEGAAEYAYTWLYMSNMVFGSAVKFIGPTDAMFKVSNGTIKKYYDASTDRLMIEVDGDLSISNVSLSFAATLGTKEISSEDYVLGLNGNISVAINSGTTTVNQDLAMLPGAHMTIGENASVVIGEGKRLYVYDSDQWSTYVHYKNTEVTYVRPLIYAPTRNPQTITEKEGKELTNADLTDASILIKGTLDASKGSIYTTASGAQITGSEGGQIITTPGTETITYQLVKQSEPTYDEIPITPAVLQNAEGKNPAYAETAGPTEAVTYTYSDGMWRRESKFHGISVSVNDALDMNFYIAKSQLIQNYPYKAVIKKYFATGYTPGKGTITPTDYTIGQDAESKHYSEITIEITPNETDLKDWTTVTLEGIEYIKFSFSDISAKEMCDDIVVTIQYPDKQNDQIVLQRKTSIQDYSKAILEISKDDTTITNAMVDMLNYGAAAQTYYNYGEKDSNSALILANAGLTATSTTTMPSIADSDTKCVMADGTTIMNHNKWGSRLMLINRFGMHFTFDGISTDDGAMSATMKVEGDDTIYPLSYQKAKSNDREGLRYFSTENTVKLSIKDAEKTLTVTVTDSSGNTVCTIYDSVKSYIARMLAGEAKYTVDGVTYQYLNDAQFANLTTLLNALMKFSASASGVTSDVIVDVPEEVSTNG